MIGLIPIIGNDYILTAVYLAIIFASFLIKRDRGDGRIFVLGLVSMTIFEFFFISTGVEVFARNSLLGIMPVWLPVLWAYGFIVIKRSAEVII